MKKPLLISIAILTVLFVIFVVSEGGIPLEAVFPFAVFSLLWSLPGILLSLIVLIPAVRKRAQSTLAVRVITILVVMILSVVVMFSVTKRLEVETFYVFLSIPSMGLEEDPYEAAIAGHWAKYEEKREAIVHETWIRVLVPPLLRRPCYTIEKDVYEFVDLLPKNIGPMSQNNYYRGIAFIVALSLPGGVFAWHFTRRKYPQEVDIEVSDEKK
ncbi:hypothetical protein ACFLXQ_00780 [Chloroflexota bacterium]